MKHIRMIKQLLENAGLTVERDGEMLVAWKDDLINPADVRLLVSTTLSQEGWQGYLVKEVYAYMGSKKPYRTDEFGCVEITFWEDFKKVDPPVPNSSKKIKFAPDFKVEGLPS